MEPPLLYDVNLMGLTAEQLQGPWRLLRLRTAPAAEPAWAEATHLQLREGTFELGSAGTVPASGIWHLRRHDRLSQPFLVFESSGVAVQALVTRLRCSPDGALRQMVLYFQSGLELQLTHP